MAPHSVETLPPNEILSNEEMEVDFDKNVTRLYQSISNADWDDAMAAAAENPEEARTWVVRHENGEQAKVMWRFLPIHSACARQPPESVIVSLLTAYAGGAGALDDQGMFPLHYACGNQASSDVIRLLLLSFPKAASSPDPHGMLPIHYLAQWGPASPGIVDMLLFSNREAADAKDVDGNTPLDLAKAGDYPEKDEVVKSLMRMTKTTNMAKGTTGAVGDSTEDKPKAAAAAAASAASAAATVKEQVAVAVEVNEATATATAADDDVDDALEKDTATRASVLTAASSKNMDMFVTDKEAKSANRTIAKLKAKVTKLEAERAFSEAELEERMENEREVLQEAIDDLKKSLEELKKESGSTKEMLEGEVSGLKDDISEKKNSLAEVGSKLEETESSLTKSNTENDRLKSKLENVTKEHEELTTKTTTLEEHLSFLSDSMATMLAKQEKVMDAAQRQEDQMKKASALRRKKIEELLEQDAIMMQDAFNMETEAGDGEESVSVKEALQAQKEQIESMKAIMTKSS